MTDAPVWLDDHEQRAWRAYLVASQRIDAEIRRIIDEQYALARRLVEENRDKVEAMTRALLEYETIDAEQVNDIMEGRPPRAPRPTSSTSTPPASPPDNTPSPAPTATPAREV